MRNGVAVEDPPAGYRHEALMYSTEDEFLQAMVEFIGDGVVSGEPVLVVLKQPKLDAIRAALGPVATQVSFADMGEVGANPGRIIGAWHAYLSAHERTSGPIRGIGEPIDAERSATELVECQLHEALLNLAFSGWDDFWLLCPYDLSALDDAVIAEALRSHPYVACGPDRRASALYRSADPLALFDSVLPEPPSHVVQARFSAGDLDAVRDLVAAHAGRHEFGPALTADVVLAVNELATNAIEYGDGEAIVRLWADRDSVLFEITNRGQFDAPLAGRIPPPATSARGRGLWIANQLCDLVQIRTAPNGTVVRAHVRVGARGN